MKAQLPSLQAIATSLQTGDILGARKQATLLCHTEPTNLQAWYFLATASAQLGALDDVVNCCQRILKINPCNLSTLYNLGTALTSLNRHKESIQVYEQLVALQPHNTAALCNMAISYRAMRQYQNAIAAAERALAIDVNIHAARNILGLAYLDSGNAIEAEKHFRELAALTPGTDSFYYNWGLALLAINNASGTVNALRTAITINESSADAATQLSGALHKSGDHAAALEIAERTAKKFPNHAGAQDALGVRLTERGQMDSAHKYFEQARTLAPKSPDILCHLGNCHIFRGEVRIALSRYDGALIEQPDHAQSHWQRGWCLLLLGELSEGWKEYEWRFQAGIAQLPGFPQPLWQGEPLEGHRILLFDEQGFGDSIQFVRYSELVKQRGAEVIVRCRKELKAVYETCPGVDLVIDETDPLPAFDVQAPLLSLPRLFDTVLTTIPARTPYLFAPMDRTVPCALANGDNGKLKVGITWSGNPAFRWNRFRSCSLKDIASLALRQDIQLFSLQKGTISDELQKDPLFAGVVCLGAALRDFADTAAAMLALDLVITTDTSVAHIAGALGCKTWLLLSYAADWRWLQDRSDSPWYPSLRLFRQLQPGDWATPIQAINQALDSPRNPDRDYIS